MTGSTVTDIAKGRPDAAGALIIDVFTKIDNIYAVYRTEQRVMIQFADDQLLGADQRKSLTDIYVLRGQINGMLDDMRASRDERKIARAVRFERRLADALILGLQGQSQQSLLEMESLKKDLDAEQSSRARLMYMAAAVVVVVLMICGISFVNSGVFAPLEPAVRTLWFAAAVGTVGSFFSIAIAIRNRTIEADKIRRDNIVDAALRVLVGALAGALLMALVASSAFSIKLGGAEISAEKLNSGSGWLLVLLGAFVAGFFERLVPDMLSRAVPSDGNGNENAAAKRKTPAADATANERDPLGTAAAAGGAAASTVAAGGEPADEADAHDEHCDDDNCVDHTAESDTEVTDDVELPAALGGVESK